MRITEQEVRYVADLANLNLGPEETARMTRDLEGILDVMARLQEIDTTGIEPMAQVLYDAPDTAALRDDLDRPERRFPNATVLENAALSGGGYFKVPKVIER
ncbi:MAG: Asp-tRNA(Asn)/Glu-tRNA(Gln) amidotransferase subunit GatC [Bryobacteraceae bacterium]|nr:Asp-tRNA(Asn)/Glu-tRNA(Gln) amidotransferase subunit GatC [Bryobacteraceae bacterium]